ncbi:MAG: Hsp20/alpha crystallin family protein [Gemmatimonadaceae bacterium]
MTPNREQQQQRERNDQQTANRSSTTTGTATQATNTADARNEGRPEAGSSRSDQERAIQAGREGSRSTGVGRRAQTSPVYGAGASLATPFTLMRRMADDMDRLFENFGLGSTGFGLSPVLGTGLERDLWGDGSGAVGQAWTPQIETFRRGDKLVVRADLPGLNKDDVNVEIENGVLSISGERREQHEENRDGYYRSERSYGQFYRALPIPEGVSDEQCEATFKDGVLEVTLPAPKEQARTAKQVPIR